MPRPSKGARLLLHRGKGRTPMWTIRDGQRCLGTGCARGDIAGAEKKLAEYIASKHDQFNLKASRNGSDPNDIKIADALLAYMTEKVMHSAQPMAGISMIERLVDFFGERSLGDLTRTLQRDYARQRSSQSMARRELEVLAAAVNHYLKNVVGGVHTPFAIAEGAVRDELREPLPFEARWTTSPATTELYRYFSTDGRLLYVGISIDALRRAKQHYKTADWIVGSASVTIERFETREAAMQAEIEAIRNERPLYNIDHAIDEDEPHAGQ